MGRVRSSKVAAYRWCLVAAAATLSVGCGRTSKDQTDAAANGAAGASGVTEPPAPEPNCGISLAGKDGRHCAVYQDGSVWCWGTRGNGDGPRNFERSAEPRRVAGLEDAQMVVVGPRHSCALNAGGQLWCWGDNESLQIDDSGATELPPTAVDISLDASPIKGFGLGARQTCVVNLLSHVYCRGTDKAGAEGGPMQLPLPGPADTTMPGDGDYVLDDQGVVFQLSDWKRPFDRPQYGRNNAWYSGPGSPSCVLKRSGSLWCTSSDPNAEDDARLFAKASLGEHVTQAGTGDQLVCALGQGRVWCEGLDQRGQPATAGSPGSSAGQFVEGLSDVRSLSVNDHSACALQGDGTISCWGNYAEDQYGAAPVPVSGCVQQTKAPVVPPRLSQSKPPASARIAEGGLARAQAICACTFGAPPPAACVEAENVAPNPACLAALLPGANPPLDCYAASFWQDAECYAQPACREGSVEGGCPPRLTCPPFEKPKLSYCGRHRCALDLEHDLTPSQICDGVDDCEDGSDERNCRDDLGGSFECNPETRIASSKLCDAVPDCNDGSDEQYCGG